jgi:hypothetical protein
MRPGNCTKGDEHKSRRPESVRGRKIQALTHLVGAVLALAGSAVLVALAAFERDAWKLVGVISVRIASFGLPTSP